jgi:hypothetical protein
MIHNRSDQDNFHGAAQAPMNCGDNLNKTHMMFGEA